jgi:hypothetical protein
MTDLYKVRDEILEIVKKRQQELQLTFEEEKHQYTMLDNKGVLKDDWFSVSKIIKKYYDEFPAEEIALKKAKGDIDEQQKLLKEETSLLNPNINHWNVNIICLYECFKFESNNFIFNS